jgi:hypothetical protein
MIGIMSLETVDGPRGKNRLRIGILHKENVAPIAGVVILSLRKTQSGNKVIGRAESA